MRPCSLLKKKQKKRNTIVDFDVFFMSDRNTVVVLKEIEMNRINMIRKTGKEQTTIVQIFVLMTIERNNENKRQKKQCQKYLR